MQALLLSLSRAWRAASFSPESRPRQIPATSFHQPCHRDQHDDPLPKSSVPFVSVAWFHRLRISLSNQHLDALRSGTRRVRALASYVVIGFFAGASATYLFEHGVHGSVAALLGLAGILAGSAVGAGFNWSKLD